MPLHGSKLNSDYKPGDFCMSKPVMTYFKDGDVLHLLISEGPEAGSVEISPNVTAELNTNGEIIGIEILNASEFLRDSIMETAQAKLLSSTVSNK
jgi:uncharacterized protein YuzE